jgi:hypothetical protein
MSAPTPLRQDFDAPQVRGLAKPASLRPVFGLPLNLTRLHLGIAHESQFQGLGITGSTWLNSRQARFCMSSITCLSSSRHWSPARNLKSSRACTCHCLQEG